MVVESWIIIIVTTKHMGHDPSLGRWGWCLVTKFYAHLQSSLLFLFQSSTLGYKNTFWGTIDDSLLTKKTVGGFTITLTL